MRAHDEIEIVFSVELLYDVGTEGERHTTIALCPSADVGVGVSPENIAQKACVRNIRGAQDTPDLLHAVQVWGEPAMYAEDLVVDDGRDGKAVENHVEGLPKLQAVAPLALVIEPIDSIDGRALVVTAKHEEVFGVLNFVRQKKADTFQPLWSTVHVVPKEQVVGLRWKPAILKKPEKIRILSMNIANNLQRRLEFQEHRLGHEDLSGLVYQQMNLLLLQGNLRGLPRLVSTNRKKALDDAVYSFLGVLIHLSRHSGTNSKNYPLFSAIRLDTQLSYSSQSALLLSLSQGQPTKHFPVADSPRLPHSER
mmetsp:Transcript_25476/g.51803  ORF Transcript_25476/g.51803 Transcript_25476/m.51803 type:complete len:309 (-) Transcript_25476:121-1047(-)